MTDTPKSHVSDEGPSPAQLVIEACRMDNTDLLTKIIDQCTTAEAAADLINNAKTVMGNFAYHEAALRGNWDVIDMLLDQEGFECDPINEREGDTPLHSVVRWLNNSPKKEWEAGAGLVEMMLQAGSDPRIRNKANLKAAQLVDPSNKELISMIEGAEYTMAHQDDFITVGDDALLDEDPTGSNSDSDFDIENKPSANGTK